MRRFSILTVGMLMFLLVMGTSVAIAQTSGVHFTRNGEPTCKITNTGTSAFAVCDAEVAGLGGEDVDLLVTLAGKAVYKCRNAGGNIAPGQNQVLVGPVTTPVTIPKDSIKNGRASLDVTTQANPLTASPTVSASDAGCPNNNWTGVNPTLTVTSIIFSAAQGNTTIFSCTKSGTLTGTITFSASDCSGVAF